MVISRDCAAAVVIGAPGLRALDAMIRTPKTVPDIISVAESRTQFEDDHVHALLLTRCGRLTCVVVRDDLIDAPGEHDAAEFGRLDGRCVMPGADLDVTLRSMLARKTRRTAVVDTERRLLGLLCLKQSSRGFCSDADVASRAAERAEIAATDVRPG